MQTNRLKSMPGCEQFHIGRSAVVKTFQSVALAFITVATTFLLSVPITIYGGFPLWFL